MTEAVVFDSYTLDDFFPEAFSFVYSRRRRSAMPPRSCLKAQAPFQLTAESGLSFNCKENITFPGLRFSMGFETSNTDFSIAVGIGASIYDSRLGRWLSLDAMAMNDHDDNFKFYTSSGKYPGNDDTTGTDMLIVMYLN